MLIVMVTPPQCESTLTLVSNMFLDCYYADLCALNLQNKCASAVFFKKRIKIL